VVPIISVALVPGTSSPLEVAFVVSSPCSFRSAAAADVLSTAVVSGVVVVVVVTPFSSLVFCLFSDSNLIFSISSGGLTDSKLVVV